MFQVRVVTEPTEEPVDLNDIKNRLRVDADDTQDDALLQSMISTARRMVEEHLGRAILTQTREALIELTADHVIGFLSGEIGRRDSEIEIPFPRLQSISLVEIESNPGIWTTMGSDSYYSDIGAEPAKIWLKPFFWVNYNFFTSYVRYRPRMRITYVTGWTDVSLVPEGIKEAIRQSVASMYGSPEGHDYPTSVWDKVEMYRIRQL